MTLWDIITDHARAMFPAFAGSAMFAIVSKPPSFWQVIFILFGGISISYIAAIPVASALGLPSLAGVFGWLFGFLGMAGCQFMLAVSNAARESAPDLLKSVVARFLGRKDGTD